MAKSKGNTVSAVWALIEPTVKSLGLSIWNIVFVKEGSDWFLRVFIDKDGGVTVDDCEAVSRAIDPIIDANDPIEQSYFLEVSSPGLERELILDEHFERFIGSDVIARLIRPIEGIGKEIDGVLREFDKNTFTLEDLDGNRLTINRKDTVWVKLDDFDK